MHPIDHYRLNQTRRHFLKSSARISLGAAALASLEPLAGAASLALNNGPGYGPGQDGPRHFPGRAKRVIYLCQSGAPSQMETLDYKPSLEKLDGQELPDSIRQGQRLTGMTSRQSTFPVTKSFTCYPQRKTG